MEWERTCLPSLTRGRAPHGFGVASFGMMQDLGSSAFEEAAQPWLAGRIVDAVPCS